MIESTPLVDLVVDYGTLSLRILEALRQKISDFGPELRRMGLGEDEASKVESITFSARDN